MPNGDLRLSIPWRKRFDEWFKQRLIAKWKKLWKRNKQTRNTFQRETDTHVYIRWIPLEKSSLPTPLDTYLRKICKEEAVRIADIYSKRLWFWYNQLRVKKVKTKRGSCSSKQNLNINLDLVHLEKKYIEYVVIHEVCHLEHKHHQKSFRAAVEQFLPHYKQIVKEMRTFRLM